MTQPKSCGPRWSRPRRPAALSAPCPRQQQAWIPVVLRTPSCCAGPPVATRLLTSGSH